MVISYVFCRGLTRLSVSSLCVGEKRGLSEGDANTGLGVLLQDAGKTLR